MRGSPARCLLPTIIVLAFAGYLDSCEGVLLYWQFCLAALLVPTASFLLTLRNRGTILALTALTAVSIATMRAIDWTSEKRFMRMFADIRTGMTHKGVLLVRSRCFSADERKAVAYHGGDELDDYLHFILDPNDGSDNAEVILVRFERGRVVDKEYHSD